MESAPLHVIKLCVLCLVRTIISDLFVCDKLDAVLRVMLLSHVSVLVILCICVSLPSCFEEYHSYHPICVISKCMSVRLRRRTSTTMHWRWFELWSPAVLLRSWSRFWRRVSACEVVTTRSKYWLRGIAVVSLKSRCMNLRLQTSLYVLSQHQCNFCSSYWVSLL